MAEILIIPTRGGSIANRLGVRVRVIELSWTDGIYGIACNGDTVGQECPHGLEPGDTWSDLGHCVAEGITHMNNHENEGVL